MKKNNRTFYTVILFQLTLLASKAGITQYFDFCTQFVINLLSMLVF